MLEFRCTPLRYCGDNLLWLSANQLSVYSLQQHVLIIFYGYQRINCQFIPCSSMCTPLVVSGEYMVFQFGQALQKGGNNIFNRGCDGK